MRGKKRFLADILFRILRCASLSCFSFCGKKPLYVLAYHRLHPLNCNNYPFSKGAISATLEGFDRQMRFVKRRFNVIGFKNLSETLLSGKPLADNTLIITFDDGYADNYEVVWEILKKYGLTATIFLAVSFIESSSLFWFDRLSYMINNFSGNSIKLGKRVFETKNKNREMVRVSVMSLFRSVSEQERLHLLAELENQCNTHIPHEEFSLAKPLSWAQVREMSEAGIEFGSHTMNHPFLANLSEKEVMYELQQSKTIIERAIDKDIKVVAYPSGSYNQRVLGAAMKCGYQFGVSYEHNVLEFHKDRAFTIPRIHVEKEVSYALFQANLLLPSLFLRNRLLPERHNPS